MEDQALDNQVAIADADVNDSEAVENQEVESEFESYDEDVNLDEQDAEPEDDGTEELEFNQKSYKLPKDIAEAVRSMRKDYTEKTMAVAEQRKEFEAKMQFTEAFTADIAKLEAVNQRLAEFEQVDWNRLSDEDPVLWQKLFSQHRILDSQRNQLAQQLAQKKQEMTLNQQQEIAKAVEASETVLRRDIKDWSPQLESNLQQFAVDRFGFDISDVKNAKTDPRLYKLVHLAYLGDQIIKKQAVKPKAAPARPVTTLPAKNTKATRDPSQMSDAEFAKWRASFKQKRGA